MSPSYKMFEDNMDEYLDEEIESIRNSLELSCRQWEHKVSVFVSRQSPTDSTL
jgi:recyclin-1